MKRGDVFWLAPLDGTGDDPDAVRVLALSRAFGMVHVELPSGATLHVSHRLLLEQRPPAARRTDPDTSHEAGARDRTTDRQRALAVHQANPDGLTDDELAVLMRRRPTSAGKRRFELVRDGLITSTRLRRPTREGATAIVWRVTAEGRQAS